MLTLFGLYCIIAGLSIGIIASLSVAVMANRKANVLAATLIEIVDGVNENLINIYEILEIDPETGESTRDVGFRK